MKNAPIKIKEKGVDIEFNPATIEKYIQNPALWFSEVLTGVLMYDRKDIILAGGQLIQGAIKLDLWGEFLHQLNNAREKGITKHKFYETRNGRINFNELFSYLDKNDTPDEEVFKAMQAIFFASSKNDSLHDDEILAYQLIQVCKMIKSIDLLVLLAAYDLYREQQKGIGLGIHTIQDWQVKISQMVNLPIDLVVQSRIKLSGNSDANYPFLFEFSETGKELLNMGLNALSISLGKFIVEGDKIIKS